MIFNAIAAGGTVPEYIWVEYEITKVAGLPWRLIRRQISRTRDYRIDKYGYTALCFNRKIDFDAATGKITASGDAGINEDDIKTLTNVDLWVLESETWYHAAQAVRVYPYDSKPWARLTFDEYVTSEPTYTITYGAIKTIHLTEQTGDQFAKIPIIK